MLDSEKILTLKKELENYFSDEQFNVACAVDQIFDSISQNIDCDFEKLAAALSLFKIYRERLEFSPAQNFATYDISTENSAISIKEVFDNDQKPVLLFFNGTSSMPFFKIISCNDGEFKNIIVETSNNPALLTNLKNKSLLNGYNYIFRDDYYCSKSGDVIVKKNIFAKSGNQSKSFETEGFDENENKFFAFFAKKLGENGVKLPKKLTNEQIQMLKCFYKGIKMVLINDGGFDFDDAIEVLNSICYDNKNKTDRTKNLNPEQTLSNTVFDVVKNRLAPEITEVSALDKKGKKVSAKILFTSNYLSVDISDAKGSKICNYMIYETDKGFTIFRGLKEAGNKRKDIFDACTFNLTGNILKFSAVGDRRGLPQEVLPIDIELRVAADGEFWFTSTHAAELGLLQPELMQEENKAKASE